MNPVVTYISTLMLGVLHALEPGHGKTFVVSYLVGEKLDFKHIVTLGFSLLVSHFFVLTIMAAILQFAFSRISNEQVFEVTDWLGPVLVLAFGLYLFLKSFREPHTHHHHGTGFYLQKPALTKTAIVGGISGLLPCPTAIAPLVMSGVEHSFTNALLYILIFVIGMSSVFIILIIIFHFMKEAILKRMDLFNTKVNPHRISGILMLIVGCIYLVVSIH